MRDLLVIAALSLACGEGGKGGGDLWSVRVSQFATAMCKQQASCLGNPTDPLQCAAFRTNDLDSARSRITFEDGCFDCLAAKVAAIADIAAQQCSVTGALREELASACDIDPRDDADFDGDPTNDLDEACGGSGSIVFLDTRGPFPGI